MTLIATRLDAASASVTLTTDTGIVLTGLVTPADYDGAPSVDCWISGDLMDYAAHAGDCGETVNTLTHAILAEARAALACPR